MTRFIDQKNKVPEYRFIGFSEPWRSSEFGEIVSRVTKSYNPDDSEVSFKCVELESIAQDNGELLELFDSKKQKSIKTMFKAGDVLFGKLRPYLKKYAQVSFDGVCSSEIWVLRSLKINNHLLYLLVQTDLFNKAVNIQSGSKMPRADWGVVSKTVFSYPESKKEQQKIASFLTAVDDKLQLLRRKRDGLQTYKRGVMQQLFSQNLRFKQDDGTDFPDWKKERLNKHIEEYKENSIVENQHEVLTSSRSGLVRQKDYFDDNRLTERSNLGFNVMPIGYLTYRSRSDDRKFYFNVNDLNLTGLISTYYPVFTMKNGNNNFFKALSVVHQRLFGKYSVGTSQVVLSFKELGNIKMGIPCDEEQKKIASYLSAIDKKIAAVSQQITQTEIFKKGLLQKMFV